MPPLTDRERLTHYVTALSFWNIGCYVHWKSRVAADLRRNYDITTREFSRLMFEHVNRGGQIDEIPETRKPWRDEYPYHYDMRFAIPDGGQVYVETVLELGREPDDARITVVSVHEP